MPLYAELCLCCSKIAEAEAAMSVNEKKWVMMHVQLKLDELPELCLWAPTKTCQPRLMVLPYVSLCWLLEQSLSGSG